VRAVTAGPTTTVSPTTVTPTTVTPATVTPATVTPATVTPATVTPTTVTPPTVTLPTVTLPTVTPPIVTPASVTPTTPSSLPTGRAIEFEERKATISPLKGAEPLVRDVSPYIVDKLAAQQLGKALFWDIQVGSDGGACASCHFAAGADIRISNQVNPGLRGGDSAFSDRLGGPGKTGPNKTLTAADFPFHKLANANDRESSVLYDTNDVFSSQGTFGGYFVSNKSDPPAPGPGPAPATGTGPAPGPAPAPGLAGGISTTPNGLPQSSTALTFAAGLAQATPGLFATGTTNALDLVRLNGITSPNAPPSTPSVQNENCNNPYEPSTNPFHANNAMARKVEPRNTPTVINAVFNYRQFWDGRANNEFNGVNPFGPRAFKAPTGPNTPGNPDAASSGTLVTDGNQLRLVQLLIPNSSLASQAVGPALSDFEMSCGNKTFQALGRKLIPMRPLAQQRVHITDSLFAQSNGLVPIVSQKGLNTTYQAMIQKAFKPAYWSNTQRVRINSDGSVAPDAKGFTQMEQNFSFFWGLAVQEYMATLISDDSPFDRAMNGDPTAMNDRARAGQVLFLTKGACANCHFGPAFSAATFFKEDGTSPKVLEHMAMGDGYNAFYDSGFYNIGVRPTAEDVGVGGTDGYGFDLSLARALKWTQLGKKELAPDNFDPTPCRWTIQFSPCTSIPKFTNPLTAPRDTVDGAFKAPTLRNIGLTPPYFHNGGESNLRDVLHFYSRGGNRRGPPENDTSQQSKPNSFGQISYTNLAPDIGLQDTPVPEQHNALILTELEIDYLVEFLLALTDERVACQSGVFDHPELPLPMGQTASDSATPQLATDVIKVLPAVGRKGLRAIGKPCLPNSGDLFGSVNTNDPRPLQATFAKILDPARPHRKSHDDRDGDHGRDGINAGRSLLDNLMLANFTGPGAVATTGTVTAVARPIATKTNPGFVSALVIPTPPPVPTPSFTTPVDDINGFTTIGFIQNATLDNARCPELTSAQKSQWGGSALINGLTITIPCNTILQMPAATFTWADLFDPAKFDSTQSPPASLTLASPQGQMLRSNQTNFSFPSTEIRVVGNIVAGEHIAGLVYVSQQSLNSGTGFITGFDYAKGVIYVGRSPTEPMARLQLNDPKIKDLTDPAAGTGRYSAGQSPDSRFSVDQQNPTIHASTGYPMCVPRTDPAVAIDPLCPQKNRPFADQGCRNFYEAGVFLPTGRSLAPPAPGSTYCSGFIMKAPPGTPSTTQLPALWIAGPNDPDSRQQAPFEIGDLITWSGTLLKGDRQGPNYSDTISVHTITADVGIFTQPGTLPAYISIGEFAVGTSPPVSFFKDVVLPEVDRIRLEANTTDVTSVVDIYLVDLDPATGAESQRWITPGLMTSNGGIVGSTGQVIDGGIVTQFFGPQAGRVRLVANRAIPRVLDSPTRYVRVALRSLCDPGNINGTAPLQPGGMSAGFSSPTTASSNGQTGFLVSCLKRAPAANGLYSGQYFAPTPEFILPETAVPGDPIVAYNFWDLGFLANGEGPGTGPLIPTPW
jgi:cytochrome c peroxidase